MDKLKIEKSAGGIAPFGGASHLKSDAEVPLSELSTPERTWVENLFRQGKDEDGPGSNIPGYTVTLISKDGTTRKAKVPETAVPAEIRARLKDRIE